MAKSELILAAKIYKSVYNILNILSIYRFAVLVGFLCFFYVMCLFNWLI